MASADESQWLDRKADVQADITALMGLGLTLDTARRLAGWNETLDYDTWLDVTTLAWPPQPAPPVPVDGLRQYLRLLVTRSESRANADNLEGTVLDAGTPYAIFIPNIAELGIATITFKLNGTTVHTEFSIPWDYAGTAPGGDANRVTFIAGAYTIEAVVTDVSGIYSFEAAFSVE